MHEGDRVIRWQSILAKSDKLIIQAADNPNWMEQWNLDVSPVWHAQAQGLPEIHHQSGSGTRFPEWRPWPGETLTIRDKFVFYLHGAGVEKFGPNGENENYIEILSTISSKGFTVISEPRLGGTKRHGYAEKISDDITKLVDAGVPGKNITVVGFSKGGRIALRTSSIYGKSNINYVILAGCISPYRPFYEKFIVEYAPGLSGNILSIYDEDDAKFSSCKEFFSEAFLKKQKEIVLRTGKGHFVFNDPIDEWIKPTVNWANNNYK